MDRDVGCGRSAIHDGEFEPVVRELIPVASSFNADLYTVAATVIPVLFVALMLQGGILSHYSVWTKLVRSLQLARIGLRAERKALEFPKKATEEKRKGKAQKSEKSSGTKDLSGEPPALALWGVRRINYVLQVPVMLVLTLFSAGEISAALALDHRHATQVEHGFVMAALIVLPLVTVFTTIAANSFEWARGIPRREPAPASDAGPEGGTVGAWDWPTT